MVIIFVKFLLPALLLIYHLRQTLKLSYFPNVITLWKDGGLDEPVFNGGIY